MPVEIDTPAAVAPDLDRLSERLEALYRRYHRARYLATDPLKYVHRYSHPRDREVVGLIAALLAYGRVGTIFRSVEAVLGVLGKHPARTVMRLTPRRALERLDGFKHRFNTGRDIAALLLMLRGAMEEHGSLQGAFLLGYEPSPDRPPDLRKALTGFVGELRKHECAELFPEAAASPGLNYLLAAPEKGSACKRWNLFLRWMVRRSDGIDLGLWDSVSPAKLIVPVDTHTAQVSRFIGLTRRKACDWKTAAQITSVLRLLDDADPVRFDFALCRMGIVGDCEGWRVESKCSRCALVAICTLPCDGLDG